MCPTLIIVVNDMLLTDHVALLQLMLSELDELWLETSKSSWTGNSTMLLFRCVGQFILTLTLTLTRPP
jgi:hypothetical protein